MSDLCAKKAPWRAALGLFALAFAGPISAATITGTVFEDRDYGGGAGRSLAASGGQPLANVRVELYRSSSGAFVDFDTTDAAGAYSLSTASSAADHVVRVVNGTVRSSRTNGGTCTTCVPVQTFRTNAPAGTAVAVTNRVGGEAPDSSDAPSNTTNANFYSLDSSTQEPQSVALVDPPTGSSTVSGIDFGFNFDTVVNTRDATACGPSGTFYPCQGSLRQFIINSNALGGEGSLAQSGDGLIDGVTTPLPAGFESSIFMIPNAALTGGIAVITLAGAMTTATGTGTRLDATTQTINVGNTNAGTLGSGGTVGVDSISLPTFQRPEVQLSCAASPTAITLDGTGQTIIGFALRQGYILLSGSNGTARNNLVGMTAAGSSADNSAAQYGIRFSGVGATVRSNFVTVNNSAIRSDGGGANSVVTLNEVARPASGHTNTFDGILLIGGASNVQITANLVRDQRGGGIELGFGAPSNSYVNVLVSNNTVQNNGFDSGSTPSSERLGMVGYSYTGTNVVFSRNRVISNAGPGLVLLAASGTSASQNSFSSNGGLSIDLDPVTRDPNGLGAPNGVTLNDANDADTGPNGMLNYPVITSATIANGELSIAGFARPNSSIELYLAEPDPTNFGEGLTYLATLGEGTGSDLDATTGSYGPGAINGIVQGSDNTNRFAFRLAVPGGVTIGSILTSTATLTGQTSEFGGNVVVTSGPALTHLKSVAVFSDPLNNQTNPKSIPGALQRYTLRITNQGAGAVDNDTIAIVDAIAANTALYVLDTGAPGSGPVEFIDGTPTSALTYTFSGLASGADDVDFSNNGGTTWTHVPTPDANGCDPAVTHLRVRPQGTMAGASLGGNPYFELRFSVRVN